MSQQPPVLLYDPAKPLLYDFNDPDSQYSMFNRSLAGCPWASFRKTFFGCFALR